MLKCYPWQQIVNFFGTGVSLQTLSVATCNLTNTTFSRLIRINYEKFFILTNSVIFLLYHQLNLEGGGRGGGRESKYDTTSCTLLSLFPFVFFFTPATLHFLITEYYSMFVFFPIFNFLPPWESCFLSLLFLSLVDLA